jgi:formate dehydrogenase major subunit
VRARFEAAWPGTTLRPDYGMTMTQMFDAMKRGTFKSLFVIGENPVQSEADQNHATALLTGLDHLVVQDIFLTRPRSSPTWCFPRPRAGARPTARW